MSSAAPVFTVRIPQFSDYRRTLLLRNATTGEYIDLTDYVVEMQIRETFEDAAALLELSSVAPSADGSIEISGTRAILVIPLDVTAALDLPDGGVYDIRFTDYDGVVQRVLQGAAVLDRGVTR